MKINLERLNEITGGDEESNKELLDLFNKTYNSCIARLKLASADDSAIANKLWADTLHELKGATGNIGCNDVYDICKKYEGKKLSPDEKADIIKILDNADC